MVGNDHGQTHHDVTQKRVADWEDGLRGVRDWFQIGSNPPGFIVIDRELDRHIRLSSTRRKIVIEPGGRAPDRTVNQEVAGPRPARGANFYADF
jgi:hypothetical protein